MQAMYLMVVAVLGMQQPIVPRTVAPALAHAQAALEAFNALAPLGALDALNALEGLNVLDALDAVGPWTAPCSKMSRTPLTRCGVRRGGIQPW